MLQEPRLRQVGDPQLAQEVCQTVFILLARKAGSLGQNVVLSGWLFRTACFVAARARRSEQRRQRREQEAFDMQQLNENSGASIGTSLNGRQKAGLMAAWNGPPRRAKASWSFAQ